MIDAQQRTTELVDEVVRALNELVIFAIVAHDTLTPSQRQFVEEADWRINSVQDTLKGWDE